MKKTAEVENTIEQQALRYLEDQAYAAMLGCAEPVRSGDIGETIGKDLYTSKLIRHVLSSSPRFTQIDRKWDLEMRYEDKQVPVERVLRELMSACGQAMTAAQVAGELSQVYERPAEYYETFLDRMLADEDKFFRTSDGRYGLSEWLLSVDSGDEEDVVFDNDLSDEVIQSLQSKASKLDFASESAAASVAKLADAAGSPVDNRYAGFFRWKAVGDDFDPVAFFEDLLGSNNLTWLSDHTWATKKMVADYEVALAGMADKIAEEVPEAAPVKTAKKSKAKEEEQAPVLSLTIGDDDLEEVVAIIKETGESRISTILDRIFEISPRDREYAIAAEGLSDAMRTDPRLSWVGMERWRMADTIPSYVSEVPAEFAIPHLSFETPEGDQIDIEIEDEGLEGGLKKEIRNPVVQDINDQEESAEQEKASKADSARCVLKPIHLEKGTFPLCQIPKGFFPLVADLIELTLIGEDGKPANIWANRQTGLMYDMGRWYGKEMPPCGAVFELHRTEKLDEYRFVYSGETDPLVFVSEDRMAELKALAAEAGDAMAVFDIMRRIMADHKKGVEFVKLFTEVNLVRRTTRRMVASILSSYYAFYQRPKTVLWSVDEKKVDQGFKKAKKKYIRKD